MKKIKTPIVIILLEIFCVGIFLIIRIENKNIEESEKITKTVPCNINNKIAVETLLNECESQKNIKSCQLNVYEKYCNYFLNDLNRFYYKYKVSYSNVQNTNNQIKEKNKDSFKRIKE